LGVHLRHTGLGTGVISRPATHPAQTPTSPGSAPVTEPGYISVAALLALVLLALARLARPLAPSPYRFQLRRGPPQFAFVR
jgi:hypothetical protein